MLEQQERVDARVVGVDCGLFTEQTFSILLTLTHLTSVIEPVAPTASLLH